MGSIHGGAAGALAALDDAIEALGALDGDTLPVADLLAAVEAVETSRRRLTALAGDLAAKDP